MGYFDEAIENRTLAHSSGPWKKHKYFQKIGEGANAVYRYAKKKGEDAAFEAEYAAGQAVEKAKDTAKEVTGLKAKDKYYEAERNYNSAKNVNADIKAAGKKHNDTSEGQKSFERISDEDVKNKERIRDYTKEKYHSTLAGKVEKGMETIKKLLGR